MRLTQTDCPFDEDDADYFVEGTYTAVAISIILSSIVAAICHFTWRLSWNKVVLPLNEAVLSVADCLVYITLTIEVLQTLALAPGMHVIDSGLAQFFAVFLVDLFELKALKEDSYFVKLSLFLCFTVIWAFLSYWLLLMLRRNGKDLTRPMWVVLSISHFIAHVGSLPILAAFVETYICDVEESNSVYLRQDCTYKCWAAQQAGCFSVSMIAVVVYSSFAILQAPLWQEHSSTLHIKEQPKHAMIRFAVQFFLLSFKRSLESGQLMAYAVIYSLVIAAWAIYCFKRKPYNYTRTSMWSFTGQIVCIWAGILLIIAHSGSNGVYLNVLLGLGWSLIIGFTLHRQCYHVPSLLNYPKLTDPKKPPQANESHSAIEDDNLLPGVRRSPLVAVEIGEVLCPSNSRVHTIG
jgi:hypothetical protein